MRVDEIRLTCFYSLGTRDTASCAIAFLLAASPIHVSLAVDNKFEVPQQNHDSQPVLA